MKAYDPIGGVPFTFTPAFSIGQIVYLKTCPEQEERIVVAIVISPGALVYELKNSDRVSAHYDFEISEELDEVKKVT
jgi:hypothetical protein